MSRTSIIVWTTLAVAACGESASPVPGNPGSSSATGGPGSVSNAATGGAAGLASTVTSGAGGSTGGGGAGPVTGSGGSTGGSAEAGAAGAGQDASPDVGRSDAEAADARSDAAGTGADGGGSCPPGAVICDDFEKYTDGATSLAPDWIAYGYSGAVKVDATKPRGGKQSLHLTVQAGMRHYADIIRETRGKELVPRKHYGRLMVWITTIVTGAQHWNINLSSGPLTGFPDEIGKFAEGGMYGKLMSNYAQRERAMANGMYLLRGGGPENGDAAADADCAVAAPSQTIAPRKWVCWEWLYDGTADTARLWLDGQAMTEVDAVGSGKQCQGPGFNGKPMTATYRWESPQVFDKVIIGWEQYQDMPAQEVWIDDLVIGSERVGCPAP